MDVFGDHWARHHERMADAWDSCVGAEDIVLSPGDFSWAKKEYEATADFAWLDERPGKKILIKGNHDYWWPSSKTRLRNLLPDQTYALKKNSCIIDGIGFFGARGGDFAALTQYGDERTEEDIAKALAREERELLQSLEHLEQSEGADELNLRVCLFHYPPVPAGRKGSRFTRIIESSGAKHCVYGHLHGKGASAHGINGIFNDVSYICTSCDLIDFTPIQIAELP